MVKYEKGGTLWERLGNELAAKIKLCRTKKRLNLWILSLMQLDQTLKLTAFGLKKQKERWKAYKAGKVETVSYEQVMKNIAPDEDSLLKTRPSSIVRGQEIQLFFCDTSRIIAGGLAKESGKTWKSYNIAVIPGDGIERRS